MTAIFEHRVYIVNIRAKSQVKVTETLGLYHRYDCGDPIPTKIYVGKQRSDPSFV